MSLTLREFINHVNTSNDEVWLCDKCCSSKGPPKDVRPLYGCHGVCDKCGCVSLYIKVFDILDFGFIESEIKTSGV